MERECHVCKAKKHVLHKKEKSVKIDQLSTETCQVYIQLHMLVCKDCIPKIDEGPKLWFIPYCGC